jgi:hypothetical protein
VLKIGNQPAPPRFLLALDGIVIKIICLYDTFQQETFKGLKWEYAFLIAAVGNIVSYYVGAVISA